ncbi:MAG: MarC family protein [Bacteroidota bacterium]
MNWNLYLNFLAAMMAIMNPLGLIPLWSELTNDLTKSGRRELARLLIATAAIILVTFMIFGKTILTFFSIELPVFQMAGGILLLFTGLSMVNGKIFQIESRKLEAKDPHQLVRTRFREILVPLAIPMMSGPGSITTVLLFGNRLSSPLDYFVLSLILLVILAIVLFVFVFSVKIEKLIDPIFFNVLTRLFGIIVVAISLQFIVEGIIKVFNIG